MATTDAYGSKRDALIAAGKAGHKIAVIGERIFYDLRADAISRDDVDIQLFKIPGEYEKIETLVNYTLVILDYEAFRTHQDLQQYFVKNMNKALEAGVNFCFVYYDNTVPAQGDFSPEMGAGYEAYTRQIGYQVLWGLQILPYRASVAFHSGKVIQKEFKPFLDRWGASHIFFQSEQTKNPIYQVDQNNLVLGFATDSGKGKIVFLPFIRDVSRKSDLIEGIKTLIDCLLTYITKSLVTLPDWAEQSAFFTDEQNLIEQQLQLEKSLNEVYARLKTFEEAKALLFQHEYSLEATLPRFLNDNLSISTKRNERHREDFWIVDKEGRELAIAEVKSVTKGFRKGLVHYVLAHRESYELGDDFPALLFVNCNLQAGSFEGKDQIIDVNDCQYAAQNNVLIIRVVDVVRLWDAIRMGKLTPSNVLTLLLSRKGWLHVKSNLEISIKPKPKDKRK